MKYTIEQFRKDYPNDAVCLDKIFKLRYGKLECCPKCAVTPAVFRRIATRRSYQCRDCYHQLYPTAGTVFEKTRTPLTYWFYAMYMMSVTRNGVSAKELQRCLGVTYKCAWRMANVIFFRMSK
jgi:transposase